MKDVNKEAVVAYMIKHDCRLDEAIAAIKSLSDSVSDRTAPTPIEVVEKVSDRKAKTKLKAARLKSGLSQSELAREADINVRTLQAYEQGKKLLDNAHLATILKLSLACGCRVEDVLEQEDPLELIREYMVFLGVIEES